MCGTVGGSGQLEGSQGIPCGMGLGGGPGHRMHNKYVLMYKIV